MAVRGAPLQAPVQMEPVIDLYVAYRLRKGRSKHVSNEGILRRFCREWDKETRHEAPNRRITALTREWVEDYFIETYGELAPTTKRAYKAVLRVFILWMYRYGVDKDAADFDAGRTAGKSERRFLWMTSDELRRTWEMEPEPYWRMLCMWMALTCCRVNEARSATWGDIQKTRVWDIHRQKTHEASDLITLPRRIRQELPRYKFWYQAQLGRKIEPTDYLFPSVRNTVTGRRLTIHNPKLQRGTVTHRKIKQMICVAMPDTDPALLERAGCHTLRRSGAQEMLNRLVRMGIGNALQLVSERLGHDSITTTEGYLNTDQVKMQLHELMEDFDLFDDEEAEIIPLHATR